MATSAETARRLQIAAIGLVSVILVGTVTRVIVSQADEEILPEEIDVVTGQPLPTAPPPARKSSENVDEPLAELGVQPTVESTARSTRDAINGQ